MKTKLYFFAAFLVLVFNNTALAVGHSGIFWNVKLETTSALQHERIARVVKTREWAVFSEAEFISCPKIVAIADSINPNCEIFISINGWAVFDNGSVYWPTHKIIRDIANVSNGWLNDVNGQPIKTNWGLRLLDIRVTAVREALISTTIDLMSKYNTNKLLFVDEAYSSAWPSLRCGYDVSEGRSEQYPYLGWDDSMRMILRRVGATQIIVNGTFPTTGSMSITGRYFQNAWQKSPSQVLAMMKFEKENIDSLKIKMCVQADNSIFWQAVASKFKNATIQEGTSFSDLEPMLLIDNSVTLDYNAITKQVTVK